MGSRPWRLIPTFWLGATPYLVHNRLQAYYFSFSFLSFCSSRSVAMGFWGFLFLGFCGKVKVRRSAVWEARGYARRALGVKSCAELQGEVLHQTEHPQDAGP